MKTFNYIKGFVAGSWTFVVGLTGFVLGMYAEYKLEKDDKKSQYSSSNNGKYVNYADFRKKS